MTNEEIAEEVFSPKESTSKGVTDYVAVDCEMVQTEVSADALAR